MGKTPISNWKIAQCLDCSFFHLEEQRFFFKNLNKLSNSFISKQYFQDEKTGRGNSSAKYTNAYIITKVPNFTEL